MRQFSDASILLFMQLVYQCPETGCWLWKGVKNEQGHGIYIENNISYGPVDKVSWDMFLSEENTTGRSPWRTCYNHRCINPKHFKLSGKK